MQGTPRPEPFFAAPPIEEQPSRPPLAVKIASAALLLTAAILGVWAAIGWLHLPQFSNAAYRQFNTVAFADDDYAVAIVVYSFAGLLLVASALSIATALVALGMLNLWRAARFWAGIVGIALIAFSARFMLINFLARIEASHSGVSDRIWMHSRTRFDQLTHWRFTPWMHLLGLAAAILAITAVLASWIALSRPASRTLYGRRPPAYGRPL